MVTGGPWTPQEVMEGRHYPRARCGSCRAEVIWTVTAATGKRMPVDAEPTPDGNVVLAAPTTRSGAPVSYAAQVGALLIEDDGVRFTSHFATCPNANEHRSHR